MTLSGFRRADFTAKDGSRVTGYNVFLTNEIDPKRGAGNETERLYLSDAKVQSEGIDLKSMVGKQVRAYYNRFGKLASLSLDD